MKLQLNIPVKQLVTRVISGDQDAFTQLFEIFEPKLINTAKRMFVSHEDAEELCQEIFFYIWQKREQIDPELSFNAYLLTILKSKLYKKAKSDARKVAYQKYVLLQNHQGIKSTENKVIFDELEEISNKAIDNLPKQQKQIFLWKGLENISSEEIAEKLGLSRRTVENHFYKATKKLRSEIEKEYAHPIKKLFVTFISLTQIFF